TRFKCDCSSDVCSSDLTQQKFSGLCSPGRVFLNWKRVLVRLNLHTYTPCQLLIRARNRSDVCSRNRPNLHESNFRLIKIMSKWQSEHWSSKHRPNFTGAEVEVLLQNVDVAILFHYLYIHAIRVSACLCIHCHLQCSCSAFIYFRTSRCLVESRL